MTRLTSFTLAALLLAPLAATQASDFHVSTGGRGTNPGTLAAPLRTIQHAAELAQPGDVITVHAGTYRERINDLIHGDWLQDKGRKDHTGAVYLNGEWLVEAATLDHLTQPVAHAERTGVYLLNIARFQPAGGAARVPADRFGECQIFCVNSILPFELAPATVVYISPISFYALRREKEGISSRNRIRCQGRVEKEIYVLDPALVG